MTHAAPRTPDVTVENHFTAFLFTPGNARAREWIEEHTSEEAQWFGHSLVVEHRFARDFAQALIDDGFEVS